MRPSWKNHFLVAGVADAATNEDGTERGFGDESTDDIGGKLGDGKRIAVHFAEFTRAGEIDLFADKGRKGEDFVEIAAAGKEVLVAK